MLPDSASDFEPFERRQRDIESAARTIVALSRSDSFGRGWRPKGIDEVAILLESLGYSRDVVAELWYPNLFAMAAEVTALIEKYVSDEERGEQRDLAWFRRACRDYAIGSLYSGPWIIAVIGLAVFGASLWSSLSTPLHLATAIALGVYAAQMISGFFAQAIARRLTFYALAENTPLMAWTFDRFIGAGLGTSFALSLLLWAVLRTQYGDPDALLAAGFCLGSSIFQLSLAPLYTLRRFGSIILISAAATLATGVTFVLFFHRHVEVPWEPSTLAAEIGLAGLITMAITRWRLRRRSNHDAIVAPSLTSIVRATMPYAVFGILYFAAILCDRFFAGFATGGNRFQYASAYELGTDIALLAILPVTGVVNVVLESLPRRILAASSALIGEIDAFQRAMVRFYLLGIGAIGLATIAAIALGEIVGPLIVLSAHLGGSESSMNVLRESTVGYAVVMIGLLNVQLLFFLSRPRAAVIAAGAALLTNAAWGVFAIARGLGPDAMAIGLVLGALVFASVTTIAAYSIMSRFVYAYYAAY